VAGKLLNMRDFRQLQGFPLAPKTRYNSTLGKPAEAPAWPIFTGMLGHAKMRHWPGPV
jgi:hypothetical protein